MPTDAADAYTTVFQNGTRYFRARLEDAAATVLGVADISAITYTIYLLDDQDPTSRTAVTGHSAVSLTVAGVMSDTLSTAGWTKDTTGYNFSHQPSIASNPAFGTAGRNYLVEYTFTPASGEKFKTRFRVACI